jgi:pyridoxine kinase
MLESISKTVRKLKELNPDLIYVCDPVCGDDGRLYCSDDIPDAFAKVLLPLATIITPNQFEAELLTGTKISSIEDAVRVCRLLHDKGPTTVILSSLSLPEAKDTISILASVSSPNTSDVFMIDVKRIDGYFTGTGDLFSALLLGYIDRYPNNFGRALEIAVSALQVVLKDTAEKAEQWNSDGLYLLAGSAIIHIIFAGSREA